MATTEYKIKLLEKETRAKYDAIFNKGRSGYNMDRYKTDSIPYKKAKEEYDKLYPAYLKLKEKNNNLIAKYKDTLTEKNKTQVAANKKNKTGSALDAAKEELQRAKDSQDPTRIQLAEDNVRTARAEYRGTPVDTQTNKAGSKIDLGIDADKYTLLPDGRVVQPGENAQQVFIVPIPTTAGGIFSLDSQGSSDSAIRVYIKNYASETGQIEALKKQLVASGYLTQEKAKSDLWYSGLSDMIAAYTTSVVEAAQFGGATEPESIQTFLKTKIVSGTGGSGSAGRYQVITTRGDAKRELNDYLTNLRGSGATSEEFEEFYKDLSARESKGIRTTKNGVVTGSVVEPADRVVIAANIARKSFKNTDVDVLLSSSKGSTAALAIAELQEYAADYGIDMSATDALKYVAQGLGQGLGQEAPLKKQQERIRQLAMTMNPNLREHIIAGGTIRDVANEYASVKSRKLGVVIPTSTKDKDVMDAVRSGESLTDFDRKLQSNPLWRGSPEARAMAEDFTEKMIKTFGLG